MRGDGTCGRGAIGADGFADIETEGCDGAAAGGVIELGAATCAAGVVAAGTICDGIGVGGIPACAGG